MFLLVGVAMLTAGSLGVAVVWRLVMWLRRRPAPRYWRHTALWHLLLIPLYATVVMPGALGFMISRQTRTRGDESSYAGPRVDLTGKWHRQSRESLAAEARGESPPDPNLADEAGDRYRSFETEDGVRVGGYLVENHAAESKMPAVLVHGFFRGAFEIEPVAEMFYAAGCDVLLLEMRCHGRSERVPFTFGAGEAEDVIAAVRFLRSRPGRADDPVVLFGVSLGAAAVALAAPRIERLAGVALDAPTDSMLATAERMFGADSSRGRRRLRSTLALPWPFPWLLLRSVELWSRTDLDDIRPIRTLPRLPADLPALIVGGGLDERMPPDVVYAAFEAVPSSAERKELWIRDDSGHGHVWRDDPEGYRERVARLVAGAREYAAEAR